MVLGLREKGVGVVRNKLNSGIFPEEVSAKVDQIRDEIIQGKITVPSTR
jgi:basic membrane lipoprotein Med (substrate-binding protein (PBP1-ABC) superfamily)